MGLCLDVEVFRVTECLLRQRCVSRWLCWVRCLSTRLLRSRRSKASKRSSTVSATVATMLPSRWPLTASLDWLTPAQVSERVESMIPSVTPPSESAAFCQRQHPVVCFSSLSVSAAVISSVGNWQTDGQTLSLRAVWVSGSMTCCQEGSTSKIASMLEKSLILPIPWTEESAALSWLSILTTIL